MLGNLVRGGVAAAAIGAGVIGFGQVSSGEDETVRDDDGAIVEAGGLGAFRMQEGDCFRYPTAIGDVGDGEAYELASVEGVSCDDPHDGEVYALFDLPGGDDAPYPGEASVYESAGEGCIQRFESFVGIGYYASPTWDISPLYPTAVGWEQIDDREVVCVIVPIDGVPTTGSAAGTRI